MILVSIYDKTYPIISLHKWSELHVNCLHKADIKHIHDMATG